MSPSEPLPIPGLTDFVALGEGGFGEVYRAHQPTFSRDVAVKVSRVPLHDPTTRLRFERECRAMGMLSAHPNIVTVYESGFVEGDLPYLVMELAAGGSLADRVATKGPLAAAEVASIGVRLAGALETAHRAGILHRDVKPENVLVSAYGEPMLGDFGLARLRDAPTTQTQRLTASLLHVAPELLHGEQPSVRSDLCSLGSTLFELAAGVAPYWSDGGGDLAGLVARTMRDPAPSLTDCGVAAPLAAVVARALDRDPGRRPASARDLGEELQAAERALGGGVTRLVVEGDIPVLTEVEPVSRPSTTDDASTRLVGYVPSGDATVASPPRRRWPAVLAAAVLVAALAGGFMALRPDDGGPAEDAAGEDGSGGTAAGGSSTPSSLAPSTTLDAEAAALLDFGTARFDADLGYCVDEPESAYPNQQWQVSPGGTYEQPVGQSVTLGLRNKFGDFDDQRQDLDVEAVVLAPDGTVSSATGRLVSDQFVELLYPDSFAGAGALQPGAHTLLWRDAEGGHIVCTGFGVA